MCGLHTTIAVYYVFHCCMLVDMHTVCRICVSAPIVHDIHSCEKIRWKECTIYPATMDHSDVRRLLEKHSRVLRTFCE